jgi:hydrogenase maturation protease
MIDAAAPATLVLGLGNVLCGDDGLGIFALEQLRRRYVLPDDVALVDGGTLGLALLPTLESARRVWILDAVMADAPPGSLVSLDGESVEPALRDRLSPHQIGVADLLDALHWRDTWPEQLRVLGLVPATLELRIGLSPDVQHGLARLVEVAAGELVDAGHALSPGTGSSDEAIAHGSPGDAARALGL